MITKIIVKYRIYKRLSRKLYLNGRSGLKDILLLTPEYMWKAIVALTMYEIYKSII